MGYSDSLLAYWLSHGVFGMRFVIDSSWHSVGFMVRNGRVTCGAQSRPFLEPNVILATLIIRPSSSGFSVVSVCFGVFRLVPGMFLRARCGPGSAGREWKRFLYVKAARSSRLAHATGIRNFVGGLAPAIVNVTQCWRRSVIAEIRPIPDS